MERKEMKKRAKGLLALLLAFIMMFGMRSAGYSRDGYLTW